MHIHNGGNENPKSPVRDKNTPETNMCEKCYNKRQFGKEKQIKKRKFRSQNYRIVQ